jgi:FkbM family methyltransferase
MLGRTKIVLDTRDFSLTPHLIMDGFWESWVTMWARNAVGGGDRVLNIGANCGYYALLFAGQGCQVVAVEPQPHLAEGIRLSAALNGWSGRIAVRECIAGVAHGNVTLQLHDHFAGSAYVDQRETSEPRPALEGWTPVNVTSVPAHELMPDATCAFIDAEGYEPLIWAGLKPLLDARQLRWVALEWSPARYPDPASFLAELRAYGQVVVVDPRGSTRPIPDAELLSGADWDTLVVRRA